MDSRFEITIVLSLILAIVILYLATVTVLLIKSQLLFSLLFLFFHRLASPLSCWFCGSWTTC